MDAIIAKQLIIDAYNEGSWRGNPNENKNQQVCKLDLDFNKELATDICKTFIRNFFSVKNKDHYFTDLIKQLGDLTEERVKHIVIVYFLGLGFYQKSIAIKEAIDNVMNKYKNIIYKYEANPFPFIWFLICLSHDLGHAKENTLQHYAYLDLFKHYPMPENMDGVPPYFSGVVPKYFDYRCDAGKTDHGIYAGHVMYKNLCEARLKNMENGEEGTWKPELEKIYGLASWVVTCHNVWFCYSPKDYMNYKMHRLNELIINPCEYRIQLDEYPLLFFFDLIDTIEPVKRLKDFDKLDAIQYEFETNHIRLEIGNSIGDSVQTLENDIMNLNYWLTPTFKDVNGSYVIYLR